MIDQYPDSVVVTIAASASQSASGVWTSGATAAYTLECRAEANNAGRQVAGADGVMIDYAFQLFCPEMTTIIPVGSNVVLTSLLNGVIYGKVRMAFNGQLNSRIWL
jgi:hypothetical protein